MTSLIVAAMAVVAATTLPGDFADRHALVLERVLRGGPPRYTTDFVVADAIPAHVRRFTEFSGDVSGRYLEALAVAARESGQAFPQIDAVVNQVITHQQADGHFGGPFGEGPITGAHMAILWGNGRLLVGLTETHRLTRRADVLEAARKLGDFFVTIAPRLNTDAVQREFSGTQIAVGYICWTQIVEGLVGLREATGDVRYLELARQVAARTGRHPSQHSHGYLTSLRGILLLHRSTGDTALLAQVEREWEGLVASGNVFVHGAMPEAFKPIATRDEGCSEADWLRLNLALWHLTRRPRYLEHAELTLFNEFSFNQFASGDFGHRVLTGEGVSAAGARAWWCCTLHGLRAFPEIILAAFRAGGQDLGYELPISGRGTSGDFTVSAVSSLSRDGSAALRIVAAPVTPRLLWVRVPAWAERVEVRLNGVPADGTTEDGRWRTTRVWKTGDELTLRYALRTRTLSSPDDRTRFAIFHGPWLLGVNAHDSPAFFDEPFTENRISLPEADAGGQMRLETDEAAPRAGDRFSAPAARFQLRYLPGGYPVQPQVALLRPIADQTSLAEAADWVFWFKTGSRK